VARSTTCASNAAQVLFTFDPNGAKVELDFAPSETQ